VMMAAELVCRRTSPSLAIPDSFAPWLPRLHGTLYVEGDGPMGLFR
jgi:hypothetical protein